MRILLLFILCVCHAASAFAQDHSDSARTSQLFNFGWKFKAGEVPDAQNPTLDDSDWRMLDLPHDFQFEQPWDKTASGGRGFKAMGVGWYRKTFKVDAKWKGKRVFLDFEGIMLTGEVWVNGRKIGGTDYGYLGFESDISDIIQYDTVNVVAVRASTGESGDSRWYTGGGLFRDVHLPYRVWQNRLRGTWLGIHETAYNDTQTGESWGYPEFQGFYSGLRWANLETPAGRLAVASASPDVYLRVGTPPISHENTTVVFPTGDLSFLHAIPAIGSKGHPPEHSGPAGEPAKANGDYRGSLTFTFGRAEP